MFSIELNIKQIRGVKGIWRHKNTITEGRWNIQTDDEHFMTVKNELEDNLFTSNVKIKLTRLARKYGPRIFCNLEWISPKYMAYSAQRCSYGSVVSSANSGFYPEGGGNISSKKIRVF